MRFKSTECVYCYVLSLQLALFWLVGVVFPSSDFKHPITTPAMMIMGEILLKVEINELFMSNSVCVCVCV